MQGKRVLKRYLSSRLPAEVHSRKKTGFNAPVSHWLNGAYSETARDITLSSQMLEWFDPVMIETLWSEHRAHKRDNGFRLFVLLCLGLWLAYRPALEKANFDNPRVRPAIGF